MNWYGLIKKSAYEEWMDQIDQLSQQNPYPFNSWFGQNGRTYIPFETESMEQMYDNDDMSVVDTLEASGCTDIDYRNGYCVYNGNKYRIGKLLEYLRRKDLQELGQKAERGEIYNIDRDIEQTNKWYSDLLGYFTNSMVRANKGGTAFSVVMSQNPHDVASMSTDKHWNSCMELGVGSNHESVFCEVASGGLIAYLIHSNDTEIKNPLARIHIRRFESQQGQSVAIPESEIYGNEIAGFSEVVDQWLISKQGTELTPGMYTRMGGDYSDTFGKTTLVSPTNENGFMLWLTMQDPNSVYTTYNVVDELASEWNTEVEEGNLQYADQMEDYSKKFNDKKEAEEYLESVIGETHWNEESLREDLAGEMDFNGWSTVDEETGEYKYPRFKLTTWSKDHKHDMQNYAIKEILRQERNSFSPEAIQTVHDILFDSKSKLNHMKYISWSSKLSDFVAKYPEFVTQADLDKLQDKKTILRSYDQLAPEQQEQFRTQYTDDVLAVLDNPSVLIDEGMKTRNQVDAIFPSRVHDMIIAPLESMYKPLPASIIQKIIDFAGITEIDGYDISEMQRKYLWHYMVRLFANTGSDTPAVQRFYKSLLPHWKENHKYYGDENYGTINIGTFGFDLARLGENGRGFIPFLNEKLQLERDRLVEAKETERKDPGGGPKHPFRLHWSTLVKRLEHNIESYLYVIDWIENGKPSGKYKFHH